MGPQQEKGVYVIFFSKSYGQKADGCEIISNVSLVKLWVYSDSLECW